MARLRRQLTDRRLWAASVLLRRVLAALLEHGGGEVGPTFVADGATDGGLGVGQAAHGSRLERAARGYPRRVSEPDIGDLSDQLIAEPQATQDVMERILATLDRIEAKLDGTWVEGPNPL
jgi:hypothetical protein